MKITLQSRKLRMVFTAMVAAATIQIAGTAVAADSGESYVKDLDIRQRPMTDIKPTTASKMSVSATVDRSSRVYQKGDNVVLTVRTTEDSYIWVFDTGTSGKVHQIYPNKFDKKNFLAAGKTLNIPPAGSKYQLAVSPPSGAELITVVASKENKPLTPDLIDLNSNAGPFRALRGTAESVAKDLSITLRKQKQDWTTDQVVIRIK